LGSLMSIDKK